MKVKKKGVDHLPGERMVPEMTQLQVMERWQYPIPEMRWLASWYDTGEHDGNGGGGIVG